MYEFNNTCCKHNKDFFNINQNYIVRSESNNTDKLENKNLG